MDPYIIKGDSVRINRIGYEAVWSGRMGQGGELAAFITALEEASSTADLRRVLCESMRNLGFRYSSYHIARLERQQPNLPYAITDYPDAWADHYVREGYLQIDPVLKVIPNRLLPFRWSGTAKDAGLTHEQKRMFDEAYDAGIRGGYSIPIHGRHGEYATVTIVPDEKDAVQDILIDEKKHLLHLMALYFDKYAKSRLIDNKMSNGRQRSLLSERQMEVLRWISMGKTSAEVAIICGISSKSVDFHIDNAKKRLGTYSRTHAVVKALTFGLI